jgi:hypothetical protein
LTKLSDRYPSIKRLQAQADNPTLESLYGLVQPYLDWQLAEIDTATSDILIRRPAQEEEQLDDLLILVGPVAAAWLRYREAVNR